MGIETGRIYNEDCMETMARMDDNCVDLIVTDPPYDEDTHEGGRFTEEIKFGNVDFDHLDIRPYIYQFLRISERWVLVFCAVETLGIIKQEFGDKYIRGGIWDRVVNSPQISGDRPAQAVEGIAILHNPGKKQWNAGGEAGIWRHQVERGNKEHPTQKPLSLIVELLKDFSNKGELIYDPFMGSGTTAVACERLNREWIGSEISEEYCEIARERIKREQDQEKLF
jgi:site-specific DNA-methyltransferase (adenine-specific)